MVCFRHIVWIPCIKWMMMMMMMIAIVTFTYHNVYLMWGSCYENFKALHYTGRFIKVRNCMGSSPSSHIMSCWFRSIDMVTRLTLYNDRKLVVLHPCCYLSSDWQYDASFVFISRCSHTKRLVAGFSTRRPGIESRQAHARYVVQVVALGQVILGVFRFFSVLATIY
jgi:hypothetical protein